MAGRHAVEMRQAAVELFSRGHGRTFVANRHGLIRAVVKPRKSCELNGGIDRLFEIQVCHIGRCRDVRGPDVPHHIFARALILPLRLASLFIMRAPPDTT